jgi:protein PhnA
LRRKGKENTEPISKENISFKYLCKKVIMSESTQCPKCQSPYGYPTGTSLMCPECGHEWNPNEAAEPANSIADDNLLNIKDANGNVLQDGDTVILIKDLPVKGAPKPIKAGTKVKNIKLTTGDHNIDCKVDGFGAMALKSIYVRKG